MAARRGLKNINVTIIVPLHALKRKIGSSIEHTLNPWLSEIM
jgi:hypothetical protein